MKKNLSQLRAISYAYSRKNHEKNERILVASGLDLVFNYQTKYKTIAGFNSAKTEKKIDAVSAAIPAIKNRIEQLQKCGCTSEKYDNAMQALNQANLFLRGAKHDNL